MSEAEKEKIFKHIDELRDEAVELMKAIVPIKALGPTNGGTGEAEKAEFLKNYLKTLGITDIKEYPAPDSRVPGGMRPNLVAKLPGKSVRTVWILGHLDVVPEGDLSKWDTDPFEAVVKGDQIFGRGTEDNNHAIVTGCMTAKAFLDLGIRPEYSLGLVFVADEETGSKYGLEYLLENHPNLFREDDLIIVPDAGESDSSMIEVAEKSILWVKFKTIGKQTHASMPEKGINAFRAASHLVVALEELGKIYDKEDPIFDPPKSTFEPTRKEANVPNINTIPGDDIFYFDARILPDYNIDDVLDKMRQIADKIEKEFKVKIELSKEQYEQAAPATDPNAPVVQALKVAIKEVYNVDARPMGIGGGTVAAIFRRKGFQAAVWSTIDDMAHEPNEYDRISNIINDTKVFAHVCLQNK
ncbi:diaminopimelate aminotransferase [candidate division KSB1 bacterium]|nr:MAG: diaminopimelate aminotransferase [candidate division KSB1 bacterium]